jgi:hypothetical protein
LDGKAHACSACLSVETRSGQLHRELPDARSAPEALAALEAPGVRTHFETGRSLGPYAVICPEGGEVGHFHDPVVADEAAQAHQRKHLD